MLRFHPQKLPIHNNLLLCINTATKRSQKHPFADRHDRSECVREEETIEEKRVDRSAIGTFQKNVVRSSTRLLAQNIIRTIVPDLKTLHAGETGHSE